MRWRGRDGRLQMGRDGLPHTGLSYWLDNRRRGMAHGGGPGGVVLPRHMT